MFWHKTLDEICYTNNKIWTNLRQVSIIKLKQLRVYSVAWKLIQHTQYNIPKLSWAYILIKAVISPMTRDPLKINLLCIFPLYYALCSYLLWEFSSQQLGNSKNNCRCKEMSLVENYSRNLTYSPWQTAPILNTVFHCRQQLYKHNTLTSPPCQMATPLGICYAGTKLHSSLKLILKLKKNNEASTKILSLSSPSLLCTRIFFTISSSCRRKIIKWFLALISSCVFLIINLICIIFLQNYYKQLHQSCH